MIKIEVRIVTELDFALNLTTKTEFLHGESGFMDDLKYIKDPQLYFENLWIDLGNSLWAKLRKQIKK